MPQKNGGKPAFRARKLDGNMALRGKQRKKK